MWTFLVVVVVVVLVMCCFLVAAFSLVVLRRVDYQTLHNRRRRVHVDDERSCCERSMKRVYVSMKNTRVFRRIYFQSVQTSVRCIEETWLLWQVTKMTTRRHLPARRRQRHRRHPLTL